MFSLGGGGAERTVVNIINNIDQSIFEITLVIGSVTNNEYLYLIDKNIKIDYLYCARMRNAILKLIKKIRKEKPDLLFTTITDNNITLLIAKLLSLKKTPVIVRETNYKSLTGKISFLKRIIIQNSYNFLSKKVIALSEGVKSDLIKNFAIKKVKIKVIYNPIEFEYINKVDTQEIEDVEFSEEEKIIITVGRLAKQKDHHTLLKAFKIVSERIKVKLLIVGKGQLEQDLKKTADKLAITDKVYFLGFKKNPYKYMKKSDVFVLSSKFEGFGHVIVEAMATGTPVISTDCPSGPSEILGSNEYGILVPVGDYESLAEKILDLIQDDEKIRQYQIQGYKRAQLFKANKIVAKYEDVFRSVIKDKKQ